MGEQTPPTPRLRPRRDHLQDRRRKSRNRYGGTVMGEIIPFPGSEQDEEPQVPVPHVIRIKIDMPPPAPSPSPLPAIITIMSLLVIGISIGSMI